LSINDKIHCHGKSVILVLRPTPDNIISTYYRQLG